VLCTVKLSRKLYPQHHRHNLDVLIERHGLRRADRHRALGDARLIWQFWQTLQREHAAADLDAAVAQLTARPSLPPQLNADLVEDLPEGHGVYLFYGDTDLPLYIGRSKNLKKRVLAHFSADHGSAKEMSLSLQVKRIDWIETAGELGALLKEAALVKQLQPMHNRRLRRSDESCTWRLAAGEGGALRPEAVLLSEADVGRDDALFGVFKSRREAERVLAGLAAEHGLCPALLGLEKVKAGKPCFAYQLKKCKGACVGIEPLAAHNARLVAALVRQKLPPWPYAGPVGVREGEELHLLDAWRYLGSAKSEPEVWRVLEQPPGPFDADIYKLLRKSLAKADVVPLPPRRTDPSSLSSGPHDPFDVDVL
jgi:DNA polymerase-3 subunit epsilon